MMVIRPADANETTAAWKLAIDHTSGPVALVLTRQNLPILDPHKYAQIPLGVKAGGYVLAHSGNEDAPKLILAATGSEVHLALAAREKLEAQGVPTRVVSLPCISLFCDQPEEYRKDVLPEGVPILSIEAGDTLGWRPYIGAGMASIGVDHFGASAPGKVVMEQYGLNVDNVVQKAMELVK
jgi:transketolase